MALLTANDNQLARQPEGSRFEFRGSVDVTTAGGHIVIKHAKQLEHVVASIDTIGDVIAVLNSDDGTADTLRNAIFFDVENNGNVSYIAQGR